MSKTVKYTSFTISKGKNAGEYKIWFTTAVDADGWESQGNFMELYPVSGVLVGMRFMTKPVAVYKDIADCCEKLEKQFGIRPILT